MKIKEIFVEIYNGWVSSNNKIKDGNINIKSISKNKSSNMVVPNIWEGNKLGIGLICHDEHL